MEEIKLPTIKTIHTKFNKVDRMKAYLYLGEIHEINKEIKSLLNRQKLYQQDLAELIRCQLEKQDKFEPGEVVLDLDYNYLYTFHDGKLNWINKEQEK